MALRKNNNTNETNSFSSCVASCIVLLHCSLSFNCVLVLFSISIFHLISSSENIMNLPGYGELVECPYNKAHQLLKSRIQTHLIKCRKSYPKVQKVQCPFNVTHLINEPELDVSVEQKRVGMLNWFDRRHFNSIISYIVDSST